jgi:hypothetical protein
VEKSDRGFTTPQAAQQKHLRSLPGSNTGSMFDSMEHLFVPPNKYGSDTFLPKTSDVGVDP